MRLPRSGPPLGVSLLTLVLTVGCQPPAPSAASVHGKVLTTDEQPLSAAVITLEPLPGTPGPNASTGIFDGQFEFSPAAGLRGGRYRVRISLLPPEMRAKLPPEVAAKAPPADAVIAPKYDGESEVSCELQLDQPNSLTFTVGFL